MNTISFPHEVQSGKSRVRIYRYTSRGYEQFRISHYAAGRRKQETFALFPSVLKRARQLARGMNKPN